MIVHGNKTYRFAKIATLNLESGLSLRESRYSTRSRQRISTFQGGCERNPKFGRNTLIF
jgi:hypothetical protein